MVCKSRSARFMLATVLAVVPVAAGAAADRHNGHRRPRAESRADALNDGQLDRNYHGPWHYMNGTRPYAPDARYVAPPSLPPSGYVASPPPRL